MGHFLYRFSTFSEKVKKIYQVEIKFFCRTLHRIPFIWPLRLPLLGLRFVKKIAIFQIINTTDSLVQNVVRIVCLLLLIFEMSLPKNPGDHVELRAPIYQNQTSFPHALSMKQSRSTPIFISFLKQVNHYLSAVEVQKKILSSRNFLRNVHYCD